MQRVFDDIRVGRHVRVELFGGGVRERVKAQRAEFDIERHRGDALSATAFAPPERRDEGIVFAALVAEGGRLPQIAAPRLPLGRQVEQALVAGLISERPRGDECPHVEAPVRAGEFIARGERLRVQQARVDEEHIEAQSRPIGHVTEDQPCPLHARQQRSARPKRLPHEREDGERRRAFEALVDGEQIVCGEAHAEAYGTSASHGTGRAEQRAQPGDTRQGRR